MLIIAVLVIVKALEIIIIIIKSSPLALAESLFMCTFKYIESHKELFARLHTLHTTDTDLMRLLQIRCLLVDDYNFCLKKVFCGPNNLTLKFIIFGILSIGKI